MSKRVRFDEDSLTAKIGKYDAGPSSSNMQDGAHLPGARFKENNNSIDSDDEEEEKKKKNYYEKLTEEDVEGAENEEDDREYEEEEDGPRITPFNLKEEMEEGDFDKAGHYHFKKEKEIRDGWLDNIDWVKVKKSDKSKKDFDSEEEETEPFDEKKVIDEILGFLQKGETVSGGLRRLGGSDKKKKKSRPWKREKIYDLEHGDDENMDDLPVDEINEEERKKQFLQLTESADQMASAGHYDIYSDTFEKLQHKLTSIKAVEQLAVDIPEGTDDDDALNMFANDIDAAELKEPTSKQSSENQANGGADDDSVKWEYKWSEEATELFGPFTSVQMAEWKEQGYFQDGVKVRRKDIENAPFYNAKRIDYDLYD